jgi:hypothetical protein
VRALADDRFMSVEGNTAVGDDWDGGEVMRRERRVEQTTGFGRLGD